MEGEEALRHLRVFGSDPYTVGKVLDSQHRRIARNGDDDLDRIGRRFRVLQLSQTLDLGTGLVDPIAHR